jgi:hypothetical protein
VTLVDYGKQHYHRANINVSVILILVLYEAYMFWNKYATYSSFNNMLLNLFLPLVCSPLLVSIMWYSYTINASITDHKDIFNKIKKLFSDVHNLSHHYLDDNSYAPRKDLINLALKEAGKGIN